MLPHLATAVSHEVTTIDDVLGVMDAIQAVVQDDGIGCFNRLYRLTTKNIQGTLAAGGFVDAAFTTRLDVVFARYYFRALGAFVTGDPSTPRAWLPLFQRRADADVAPVQFALAGMNAHIDRDLSFALVDVAAELGAFPTTTAPAHRDYETVNDVLAATERQIKAEFEGELLRDAEPWAGHLEDVVALYSVRQAREAAWLRAQAQWALRDMGDASRALSLAIDTTAYLASRALLLPTRAR